MLPSFFPLSSKTCPLSSDIFNCEIVSTKDDVPYRTEEFKTFSPKLMRMFVKNL